jgi:hypothetical protein
MSLEFEMSLDVSRKGAKKRRTKERKEPFNSIAFLRLSVLCAFARTCLLDPLI